MLNRVGIPWICYRGRLGPSAPKLEKESENEFPSAPGPKKSKTESKKSHIRLTFQLLQFFFDSVFDFLG